MRKQTKKSKDKDVNGHKMKERLKSTQEEPLFDQDMEDEIERIKHLPAEEFSKIFEKMLVCSMDIVFKLQPFTKFRPVISNAIKYKIIRPSGNYML